MRKFLARLNTNQDVTIFDNDTNILEVSFYQIPIIENSLLYVPDIALSGDEWYYVEISAEQKEKMIDTYMVAGSGIVNSSTISSENYDTIKLLYLIEETINSSGDIDKKVIFTKITPKYVLEERKVLKFLPSGNAQVIEQEKAISFNGSIDAYFDGKDRIYFKNFSTVKTLFKGFSDFYKKATEEEKMEFLENPFFTTSKDRNKINVGERNLRRIASVLDTLIQKGIDLADQLTRDKYISYANKYKTQGIISIDISSGGELEFESNEDIGEILDVLEENLYTTEISGESRVSHTNKTIA